MLENPEKKNVSCLATSFQIFPEEPAQHEAHQDELDRAAIPSPSNDIASNVSGPRCIKGELVWPRPPSDDSPPTARQASTVCVRQEECA